MLKVIARKKIESSKVDFVKAQMLTMVDETRKESGCVEYMLHQDIDDKAIFFFYETWKSEEDLNAHLKTEHVQNYIESTKGMIEEFQMNKLELVC